MMKTRIPAVLDLKYTRHATLEQAREERGFIKNRPLKFFKFYAKHEVQGNGTIKAFYPYGKYVLVLILTLDGTVITNYLKVK